MKKLLFALLLFYSAALYAQDKNEMAIRKILNTQMAAWNLGDLDAFMDGYWKNDSLMFIGKSGVTYGWANTLKNYKKGYPDKTVMGQLTFTLIKVDQLSPNYYYVTGKWHLERTIGNLEGHYSLLFKKIQGRWVIISDHSS